jgi:hypothetical protein
MENIWAPFSRSTACREICNWIEVTHVSRGLLLYLLFDSRTWNSSFSGVRERKKVTLHLSFFSYIIFIDCHFRKTDDMQVLIYQLKARKLARIGFMDIDPTSSDSLKKETCNVTHKSIVCLQLIMTRLSSNSAWGRSSNLTCVLDGSHLSWPQVATLKLVTLTVSHWITTGVLWSGTRMHWSHDLQVTGFFV